jgi:hypothetical protein
MKKLLFIFLLIPNTVSASYLAPETTLNIPIAFNALVPTEESSLYIPPPEEEKTPISDFNESENGLNTPLELIIKYFPQEVVPHIYQVFKCESGLKQTNSKGEVITSHTNDKGIAQIHLPLWYEKSLEMGLDIINSMEDNIIIASYIYEHHGGLRNWVCWSKIKAL